LVFFQYSTRGRCTSILHSRLQVERQRTLLSPSQFKSCANFPDIFAPVIFNRKARVGLERFLCVFIQDIELPQSFDGDGRTRALVFAVLDFEGETETLRPALAR